MTTKTKELPMTFNFKDNPTETMTLETLKRTYPENDAITFQPLKGMYHYQVIERVQSLLESHKLPYRIEEIFAASNKDKYLPGVVINPEVEKVHGKAAVEAHCLRRIYTTIKIEKGQDEDTETGLVIAYHQNGIQIAIGPNIKMCKNQCILSPARLVSTYGTNKVSNLDKLFEIVDDWLHHYDKQRQEDMDILNIMKKIKLSYRDVAELIGHLTYNRVGLDKGLIRNVNPDEVNETILAKYPLNNTQINEFVEQYLIAYRERLLANEETDMTLYEIYSIATELYKPNQMVIPNIIQQNLAWTEILINLFVNKVRNPVKEIEEKV